METNKIIFGVIGIIIGLILGALIFKPSLPTGSPVLNRFSTATHSQISVAITSTDILDGKSGRQYVSLCNTDAANFATISLGETAVGNEGIKLEAGECYEIKPENLFTGKIYGIANTAAVIVGVIEK